MEAVTMAYRVRARRAKVARYILDLDAIREMPTWTRDEWIAFRDETLRLYAGRLDTIEPLWRYEPGIPAHLRIEPDEPDPRVLVHPEAGGRGRFVPVDPAVAARFETERIAHDAVIAGRLAWLADHPLDH
jgi:hypothetical protein